MDNLTDKVIEDADGNKLGTIDFTRRSEECFYSVVDLNRYCEDDSERIWDCLCRQMRCLPFGDYLKRYIFVKTRMSGSFREIPLRQYQHIIVDSFAENHTPNSFTATSAKLSALAKNWLTQKTVSRSTVFLLGFGLRMSADDVAMFLHNAIRERGFNAADPFEVICWYCYRFGYPFIKHKQLMQKYEAGLFEAESDLSFTMTGDLRKEMYGITDEDSLFCMLHTIGKRKGASKNSSAQRAIQLLYDRCLQQIAACYQKDEDELCERNIKEFLQKESRQGNLFPSQCSQHIQEMRAARHQWRAEELSPADIERFLYSALPMDRNGNISPFQSGVIKEVFSEKRLTRQRLHSILQHSISVDRYDLLTLNFLYHALSEEFDRNFSRYLAFETSMNQILNQCVMGELYLANPYESFLLMCLLTDVPLATYNDVLEISSE